MQSEGYSGNTYGKLIFMPSGARYTGQSTEGLSGVGITLDRSRLQDVFRTMLASDETLSFPDCIDGFPLLHGLKDFQRSFDLLFRQIDALGGDAAFLAHSGFDDSFYRHVLMVLQTERLSKKPKGKEKIGPIDSLCEYLSAHFSERITLTQMEQISGLSARSLQYSFLERFGCAPTVWLRNLRLDRARQQLMRTPLQKTITQIAYDCGFSSVSQFGQYYRQRFGTPPSASAL